MKAYLVEFVRGATARLVMAEGWLDDGRCYLMLDPFRVDHDARFEHREVVVSFAKVDLVEPPRAVELGASLVSEPSRAYVAGGQLLLDFAPADTDARQPSQISVLGRQRHEMPNDRCSERPLASGLVREPDFEWLQDVPPKSTSLVSTVPAVRPGAVW